MAQLRVVENQEKQPPYPPETKANGWRPEIDLERIHQSRTWLLADREVRPWLMMLWLESWRSVPCGTLPNDDELVAARIGCKLEFFRGHREQLMRGWTVHSDGLLYHPYITEQVIQMLGNRASNAERQRRFKEASKQRHKDAVERHKEVTGNALVTRDSRVSNGEEQEQEQEKVKRYTGTSVPVGDFSAAEAPKKVTRQSVPFAQIVDLYHEMLPMLPRVEKLTETRKGHIRQRWQEDLPDMEHWRNFFAYVAESKFLTGQVPGKNGSPPFRADIEWLTRPTNFTKIAEEKYHRG